VRNRFLPPGFPQLHYETGHRKRALERNTFSKDAESPIKNPFAGGAPAVRNTYLVCYDIADDKRLRKVFKTCRDYGDHLQFSIFECQLTATDLAKMRHELGDILNHAADQVLFVDLGPTEGRGDRVISALGQPYSPIQAPCLVV
jgi:CRISPR-associated protein Cas2